MIQPDLALLALDQLPGNRQTQPNPALRRINTLGATRETREQILTEIGTYPPAGVGNIHAHQIRLMRRANCYPAAIGVAPGVVEQLVQYDPQLRFIGHDLGQILWQIDHELQAFSSKPSTDRPDHPVEHAAQAN